MKNTLLFALLLLILSCSNKNNSLRIETEKLNFKLSQPGISTDREFLFFTGDSSIMIFNEFQSSFSNLNLYSGFFQTIRSYENDPRFGETPFSYFALLDKGDLLLIDSKNIWITRDNDLLKYPLKEMSIEGEFNEDLSNYSFEINSGFGRHLPLRDEEVLLILKENGKKENQYLVKYHPVQPENLSIISQINPETIKNQSLEVKMGGMTISNSITPYISNIDNKVFVSYPFQNSFDMIDLNSGKWITKENPSNLFKKQKSKLEVLSNDLSKFQKTIKQWNNDVTFGPILKVPQKEILFRIVKGESTGLYPILGNLYIQFFDHELRLIQEEIIPNPNQDFLEEYFTTSEGIYIKTMSKNEDELAYLKLIIDEVK